MGLGHGPTWQTTDKIAYRMVGGINGKILEKSKSRRGFQPADLSEEPVC
jgi:hypothetical protein